MWSARISEISELLLNRRRVAPLSPDAAFPHTIISYSVNRVKIELLNLGSMHTGRYTATGGHKRLAVGLSDGL